MAKPKKAIHRARTCELKDGKIVDSYEDRQVVILAVVGIYAMVRRRVAMPYVALVKELREVESDG